MAKRTVFDPNLYENVVDAHSKAFMCTALIYTKLDAKLLLIPCD